MCMVDMGMIPGCSIEVLNRIHEAVVVKISQSEMRLESCLAHQIHVY